MKSVLITVTTACLLCTSLPAMAQASTGTHTVRLLTPEAALKAASAALQDCRKRGFQVAVAVVERSGVAQVDRKSVV